MEERRKKQIERIEKERERERAREIRRPTQFLFTNSRVSFRTAPRNRGRAGRRGVGPPAVEYCPDFACNNVYPIIQI